MLSESIVIGISVAIVAVSLIIWNQTIKKKRKYNREVTFTGGKHKFISLTSNGFNNCNVCNQIIGGFWCFGATECLKCGIKVHSLCILKKKANCKNITIHKKKQNVHQWREQWNENDICSICQLKSVALLGKNIEVCLWCQKKVHIDCKENIESDSCDCGVLASQIISPIETNYNPVNQSLFQQKNQQKENNNHYCSDDTETDTEYTRQGTEQWTFQLEEGKKPVVVVVNKKSGGQLGIEYLKQFYQLLNPIQVIDLLEDGLDRLKLFQNIKDIKIIVGGGDGTVASVINYIKSGEVKLWKDNNPPVAVLPLGTGNDLGRCLGWGGGSEGPSKVFSFLKDVKSNSQNILVDRWNLQCSAKFLEGQSSFKMYNYFSIGLDAKTCLNFHNLRQKFPQLFFSRLGNKFIYSQIGMVDLLAGNKINLYQDCVLEVDDKVIEIPKDVQNIVFINITSWAGGASNFWTESEGFKKQSLMDGMIEVMGVTSMLHLGRVQTNIDQPIKIAQGSSIKFTVKKSSQKHALQIDGEPFELKTGATFNISLSDKVKMVTHKHQKSLQFDAKILEVLTWAVDDKHINEKQKEILLNKFISADSQQ